MEEQLCFYQVRPSLGCLTILDRGQQKKQGEANRRKKPSIFNFPTHCVGHATLSWNGTDCANHLTWLVPDFKHHFRPNWPSTLDVKLYLAQTPFSYNFQPFRFNTFYLPLRIICSETPKTDVAPWRCQWIPEDSTDSERSVGEAPGGANIETTLAHITYV